MSPLRVAESAPHRLFGISTLVLIAACGRPTVPPSMAVTHIARVRLDGASDKAKLQWRGAFPRGMRGLLFAVLDTSGYVGTVSVEGVSTECTHCEGDLVDAALILGRLCDGCIAIGPISSTPRHARVSPGPSGTDDVSTTWHAQRSVDLDGDGQDDFEEVTKCGVVSLSACSKLPVCHHRCYGFRRVGESEPPRGSAGCEVGVTDVADCAPTRP